MEGGNEIRTMVLPKPYPFRFPILYFRFSLVRIEAAGPEVNLVVPGFEVEAEVIDAAA